MLVYPRMNLNNSPLLTISKVDGLVFLLNCCIIFECGWDAVQHTLFCKMCGRGGMIDFVFCQHVHPD